MEKNRNLLSTVGNLPFTISNRPAQFRQIVYCYYISMLDFFLWWDQQQNKNGFYCYVNECRWWLHCCWNLCYGFLVYRRIQCFSWISLVGSRNVLPHPVWPGLWLFYFVTIIHLGLANKNCSQNFLSYSRKCI